MARSPRLFLAGHPQHIILRSKPEHNLFFKFEDYNIYLDKLKYYSDKYKVAIHAYVLMNNSIHLVMTGFDEKAISKLLQLLGRYYVLHINKTEDHTGTLWEGPYKSTLIDADSYLLDLMYYIESKPVRLGVARHPANYTWSSYHTNALGKPSSLITPHEVYLKLGATSKQRQVHYASNFETPAPPATIDLIRNSISKAWVLGSTEFKKKIEQQTQRQVEPSKRGGDRKSAEYRKKVIIQLLIIAMLLLDSHF